MLPREVSGLLGVLVCMRDVRRSDARGCTGSARSGWVVAGEEVCSVLYSYSFTCTGTSNDILSPPWISLPSTAGQSANRILPLPPPIRLYRDIAYRRHATRDHSKYKHKNTTGIIHLKHTTPTTGGSDHRTGDTQGHPPHWISPRRFPNFSFSYSYTATRGLHSGDGGTSAIGRHDAPVRQSPLAKLPFRSIQIGLTSPIFDFSARGAARAPSGPQRSASNLPHRRRTA